MNRWTVVIVTMAFVAMVAISCSNGGTPTAPTSTPELSGASNTSTVQTQLWGYWDLYFDFENQTVEAVPNHHAEFAANVVSFLNSKGGLAFGINETIVDPAFIDVDIDVSMTHPLAGLPMYDGYDVRGIFIGDGSENMAYDGDLAYANYGGDQFMLPDPDDGIGGADGYTRWFNPDEFPAPGLLGYLPGKFATPGYTGDATLNPYKYFADDLDADGDLWDFLTTTGDNGVFSSGATNTRNYYIRFPNPVPGVKYGYAVCASWKGEDLVLDHPANATESQGVDVAVTDALWYVDATNNGGDFIADISVQGWSIQPSVIFIESEVLSVPYEFDATDMTPVGGAATYSTYHCDIPADNVTFNSVTGPFAEYWVICEYTDDDYKYPDDPSVPAPDAPLAAFFRFNDLFIADEPYNADPICDIVADDTYPLMAYDEFEGCFDATGSYDPDGTIVTWEWDFDGDGIFGETPDDDNTGTPDYACHVWTEDYVGTVAVRITDDFGATATCSTDVDIDMETSIFYQYWAPDDAAGDLSLMSSGACSWTYVASSPCWDENGNLSGYVNNCCTILATPEIDIPAGLPNLHIEVIHRGYSEYYYDGRLIGYTTNGGGSYTFNGPSGTYTSPFLTYYSGQNFASADYWFGAFYSVTGCTWFTYGAVPYSGWTNRLWYSGPHGTETSYTTSDFTMNGLVGTQNLRMAFMFKSDSSVVYANGGWGIRGIKVYFVP